ncbi:MAG: hypothetical protein HYX66_10385 [Ignavibacteria bacterium]|jgi:hypothetical protein|nr:hypothetical protein [Ignavibacteria bacterium]
MGRCPNIRIGQVKLPTKQMKKILEKASVVCLYLSLLASAIGCGDVGSGPIDEIGPRGGWTSAENMYPIRHVISFDSLYGFVDQWFTIDSNGMITIVVIASMTDEIGQYVSENVTSENASTVFQNSYWTEFTFDFGGAVPNAVGPVLFPFTAETVPVTVNIFESSNITREKSHFSIITSKSKPFVLLPGKQVDSVAAAIDIPLEGSNYMETYWWYEKDADTLWIPGDVVQLLNIGDTVSLTVDRAVYNKVQGKRGYVVGVVSHFTLHYNIVIN